MATTPPALTASPAVPVRNDKATFSARASAWATWLSDNLCAEMPPLADNVYQNALEAAAAAATAQAAAFAAYNAQGTNAASTTALSIGIALLTLEVELNKDFVPGQYITIAYRTDATQLMCGTVMSYDGGTGELVAQVDYYQGTGTYADWALSMAVRPRNGAPSLEIDEDTTAIPGVEYVLMGACSLYLPAGAPVGSEVPVVNLSESTQCWVRRVDSADKIENKLEDQRLNRKRAQGVWRKFATKGWCLV